MEPESVNENSDLYRAHPDWAVKLPGRKPSYGRNQLLLDLVNPAVRDYIVENVSRILDSSNIAYVKWDMNRHMSDMYSPFCENGAFFHEYIKGLYDVLGRIFYPRPHILFESCSSGGNRFDLGMLCYSQQIWASDDTDAIERVKIQGGLSYRALAFFTFCMSRTNCREAGWGFRVNLLFWPWTWQNRSPWGGNSSEIICTAWA